MHGGHVGHDASTVRERSPLDSASVGSGLSDDTVDAGHAAHAPPQLAKAVPRTALERLTELERALVHVAECMRGIRGSAEAAKRRRDILDEAVRGNLCEMADGQFTLIKTEADKCNMIAKILEADHTFAEHNGVFNHGFSKTMGALRAIAEENGPIILNPSPRPS